MNIDFNKKQKEELKRLADLSNMTVEEYVKLRLFGSNTNIENLIETGLEEIKDIPKNTEFKIKQLFGVKWNSLSRGDKSSLGKKFKELAKKNESFKFKEKRNQENIYEKI